MGLSFSCPFAAYTDLETGLKSIICEDGQAKSPLRPISFNSQDSQSTVMQSVGCQKMRIDGCVSFEVPAVSSDAQKKEMATESPRLDNAMDESQMSIPYPGSPKHDEAAVKLQKVYKSFRTRRKLADCAVLIEQSWWKLLDFAELKRSSISFFDIDKHETAISRWSRARTRAAKVGKGLSKNGKAQKLALQHWLEAIDPRHRYGHNLHFYYNKWLHSQSKEPFFYWLDIGEGKEVNLVEKCPRSKLQQQCIKYLGPMERKAYEVAIEDGKLLYKQTGEFVDTTGEPKGAKWIFVLSTSRILYVGIKKKGSFQHSSFLAGGATLAAGRVIAEEGVLKAIWPHSGHYRPTQENFQDFISFLLENGVDTTYVKLDSDEDDKESLGKQSSSIHIRTHSSEEEMSEKERLETEEVDVEDHTSERADVMKHHSSLPVESPKKPKLFCRSSRKLSSLEIPNKYQFFTELKKENQADESGSKDFTEESILDGYEAAEDLFGSHQVYSQSEHYMSDDEDDEPRVEETIPKECILERINSLKGRTSFQLGRQLSCKWSTGAGPRIGCLRDYPAKLQSHALEQANLSPRSAPGSLRYTNRVFCTSPSSFDNRSLLRKNSRPCRTQSSPLNMESINHSKTDDFTELFD